MWLVRISAAEMIPLTAPAVIKNRLSAVLGFPYLEEALGDFGYRGIPVNGSSKVPSSRRRNG